MYILSIPGLSFPFLGTLYFLSFEESVIPAQAGIQWHQVLRDSRFPGSEAYHASFDTL